MECCCSFLPNVFGDNQPDVMKILGEVITNSGKLWAFKENEIKQWYYKIKNIQDGLRQPDNRPDSEKQYLQDIQRFSESYRQLEESVHKWREEKAKCERDKIKMLRTIDGSLKNLNTALLKRINESNKMRSDVMKDISTLRDRLMGFQTKVYQINTEIERQLDLFQRETLKDNPLTQKRLEMAARNVEVENEIHCLAESIENVESQMQKKEFEIDFQMLEMNINLKLHEANYYKTKSPSILELDKFFKSLESLHERLQKEYNELESEGRLLCDEFQKMVEKAGNGSVTSC